MILYGYSLARSYCAGMGDNQGREQSWGPWRLDVDGVYPALEHAREDYPVNLTNCNTSAEVLDWIVQVAGKGWADDATLAGLVRAFRDVLHPQANLCSMGQAKTLSTSRLNELITEAAARHHR